MTDRIVSVCESLRVSYLKMPSGAGHDTQHVAEIAPGGMIFVPSKDGRSHCPEEWTAFEDIGLGTEVLAQTMALLDMENTHPGGLLTTQWRE
jgi:N-carbamoyl-L-amino-acid hydrolase